MLKYAVFCTAEELVQKKMTEIEEMVKHGQPVEGEYLTHLLTSEQMSFTEVLGSITELLLAGVDTVSVFTLYRGNALHFFFFLLYLCVVSFYTTSQFATLDLKQKKTVSLVFVKCFQLRVFDVCSI